MSISLKKIHILIVVYGDKYCNSLCNVTLPNIGALIEEFPEKLRANSEIRIHTRPVDINNIEKSKVYGRLKNKIKITVIGTMEERFFHPGLKHGGYSPMVLAQERGVIEASKDGAAIIFVGPDQIYSEGSFKFIVEKLNSGFRTIIGPGVRVKSDELSEVVRSGLDKNSTDFFAFSSGELINLFFDYYHDINNQFIINCDDSIYWKAYIYHRPDKDNLLIKFIQGPTLAAWPQKNLINFDGFVDHNLIKLCCNDVSQICIVKNAEQLLALDLTDNERVDGMPLSIFPSSDLIKELMDHQYVNDLQLDHAAFTCVISRNFIRDIEIINAELKKFNSEILPYLLIAKFERRVYSFFGRFVATLLKFIIVLNINTLIGILKMLLFFKFLRAT